MNAPVDDPRENRKLRNRAYYQANKDRVSFDLTKETHVRRCFHHTNLQPLWARENLRKGAKMTNPQFEMPL